MISSGDILQARILIVDDQAANVAVLEQMLHGAGYLSVTSTVNPQEVCELHRHNHYDLILLDLEMPAMDGFQVMAGLKKLEPGGELPVLVVTVEPDHKLRALKAGAQDFVSKPFDLTEVLLRVHNMLEVRLLHRREIVHNYARLENAQRLARLGDWEYDFARQNLAWSEEIYRILGLSRADTPPDPAAFYRQVHPDDLAFVHREKKAGLEDGRRVDLEFRIIRPDGEVRHIHQISEMSQDAPGRPARESGTMQDITERKAIETKLAKTHGNLIAASRMAGMAEVAIGLLHNVGNVLNSLNVSASVITTGVRQSKAGSLLLLSELVDAHATDLGDYLLRDPKGRLVPMVLGGLAREAVAQQHWLLAEIASMQKNIDHIKEIVVLHQGYATAAGTAEILDLPALFEDALRMSSGDRSRYPTNVVREFLPSAPVCVEKGKVLQILINLIRNARQACDATPETDPGQRTITVRLEPADPGRVRLIVSDNGVGIPAENLTRIFAHGFTTRADGHGFGLHASALAARELHGSLTARSAGAGTGATFTLELPLTPAPARPDAGAAELPRALAGAQHAGLMR